MLLYNYKKEFIGIDTGDLKKLGLENLSQLHQEAVDFADLFVKTPGFVHNFKHVHWIDFVAVADSTEEPKVIINVKDNLYRANLQVTTAYLADAPDKEAFMITLVNLRPLSQSERSNISVDALERPEPQATPQPAPTFTPPPAQTPEAPQEVAPAQEVVADEYDTTPEPPLETNMLSVDDVVDDYDAPLEIDDISLDETPNISEVETAPAEVEPEPEIEEESLDLPEDLSLDLEEETPLPELEEPTPQPTPQPASAASVTPGTFDEKLEQLLNSGYVYDPKVASDELGLPLDLIEEFIQDFIAQAKEFKPKLYDALEEGDTEQVKILSHKLKGVAANLRIEDALEVLTTINSTSDIDVIQNNLKAFYIIIARLAGEEIEQEASAPTQEEDVELQDDDDLILDFKDNEEEDEIAIADEQINIADEDVPEQIDLPELADDDFTTEEDEIDLEIEDDALDLEIEDDDLSLELTDDESLNEDSNENQAINYSKESAANEIGLDMESFEELFNDYVQEAKDLITQMREAAQNNDAPSLAQKALQLKGMSDNMRLTEISESLQELTQAQESVPADALSDLETIETVLDRISN